MKDGSNLAIIKEISFESNDKILHALRSEANSEKTSGCILFRQTNPTSMERPKKMFGTLWAQGENAMLFGEDGSCKTILGTQVGCNLATGQSTGPFQNEVPPQPVAFFDFELSDYQFNTRWPSGLPPLFKRFTFAEEQQAAIINADIEFVVNQIVMAADSINSKIIIMDNLSAVTSMLDLTKTSDSIQFMGLTNELKRKGYSTLIVDHTRKPLKEGEFKTIYKSDLQGSKMKSNLVDSVFAVGKSALGENFRYIKALKIRSFEMAYGKNEVATMLLRTDPLRLDFNGLDPEWKHVNDRSSQMMKLHSEGRTQAEIAKEFNISQQAVSKFLKNE